jgi:hypothetical protein
MQVLWGACDACDIVRVFLSVLSEQPWQHCRVRVARNYLNNAENNR